ncbi:uncharacterized protein PHACADRAFT_248274 [Phanerochaete carnosa HHB-10118-sp]|uniref:Uncharacterized protein n=1 Tax=Phanerochaete carnosa (strain HHB-10118-sp) TaxID=650164 RepID=K5VEY2_PHACS|nr:uncharacterized protein PHACADRAFT_248274 [Phanerochaete carnosa HHB-10118-sp]EKM61586.1 hypothetical protein PHACADRAFT_248274 [Phanerochaete carnosa HHB-10118-sp]
MQIHSRNCTKPLDVYREESGPRKRTLSASQSAFEPRKAANRSTNGPTSASARRSAKNTPARPEIEMSLSAFSFFPARALRGHTALLEQTTRTQRALIRHCFQGQMMMVSEIAEWVGVDRDMVWSVVRNEDNDNLNEDRLYLDGREGEIINVDALKHIPLFVKSEPVDDIQWPKGSVSEDEYDSEEEIEMQYILTSPEVAPRRQRRMSDGSIGSMSSLTSLGDEDAPGDPEHLFEDVDDATPEPEPSPSSVSPPVSSTAYSNTVSYSPLTARAKSEDTVEAFVRSLGGPSEQLLEVFYDIELDSAERLDWLCRQQEDYWNDVKDYMLHKGVKLFHWLVVKKGLRERAATLAASAESRE